jgi:hypothetical protein
MKIYDPWRSPQEQDAHVIRLSLCVALTFGMGIAPAYAQGPAACQPVSAAMTKLFTTDHSNATTAGGIVNQGITAGGVMYIQVKGAWRKSPLTAQAMQKQEEENIRNAKNYSCKALPDETVNGVPASVFTIHSETDAGVDDGKIWIGKANGLPLKTEDDLTVMGSKNHISIVYGYANIHAPVVK